MEKAEVYEMWSRVSVSWSGFCSHPPAIASMGIRLASGFCQILISISKGYNACGLFTRHDNTPTLERVTSFIDLR